MFHNLLTGQLCPEAFEYATSQRQRLRGGGLRGNGKDREIVDPWCAMIMGILAILQSLRYATLRRGLVPEDALTATPATKR
jgi:hypothetical protein